MDELTAFDRQIAREVLREAGHPEPVDGAAILTAITAAHAPHPRFQAMFNATRFVVAGAVALFGGVVLITQPTAPQGGHDPAAAPASEAASVSQVVGHWLGQGTCPGEGIRTATIEVVDGITQYRGYVCHLEAEWSDARLEGTTTFYSSFDNYNENDPGGLDISLESSVIHIENDEGGWWMGPVQDVHCPSSCHDGGAILEGSVPIVFEGEGAYDGLIFVGTQSDDEIRGYILEREFPPSPAVGPTE